MVTAMRNSLMLTVASVTLIVLLSAMVGYVLQRRRDRIGTLVTALMLAGLVIPPAIVPDDLSCCRRSACSRRSPASCWSRSRS